MKKIFSIILLISLLFQGYAYAQPPMFAGDADLVGPASSTDNTIPRYDGTTGKLLQGSLVVIDDSNNMTIPGQVNQTVTLNQATGDEIAHQINYTTNKATSGSDTGLLINQTDTLSPGTSYGINYKVGGVSKFNVDNTGRVTISDYLFASNISLTGGIINNTTLNLQWASFSYATNLVAMATGTAIFTDFDGEIVGVNIKPTVGVLDDGDTMTLLKLAPQGTPASTLGIVRGLAFGNWGGTGTDTAYMIDATATGYDYLIYDNNFSVTDAGLIQSIPLATKYQHDSIASSLGILTAPKAIVGFTGTGATATTENGYENGTGRVWTYSGGLAADKIFKGHTYVYSFDGVDSYLSTPDTADMSFGDSSNDSAFSVGAWVQIVDDATNGIILSKWDSTTGSELREWRIYKGTDRTIIILLYDESANVQAYRLTDAALSADWHFVVATYNGGGGATAANGITIYVDGVVVASTATNNASYVAMENTATLPMVGTNTEASGLGNCFAGDMFSPFVTAEAMTVAQVWRMYEATRGALNL